MFAAGSRTMCIHHVTRTLHYKYPQYFPVLFTPFTPPSHSILFIHVCQLFVRPLGTGQEISTTFPFNIFKSH